MSAAHLMRVIVWLATGALAAALIVVPSSRVFAAKRIDLHEPDGWHSGYAIVDRLAGRG